MNLMQIAIFIVLAIVLFELIKHFFLRKFARTIIFIVLIIGLFLTVSYYAADISTFKNNKFVQTGAVIAENLIESIPTEKIDEIPLSPNNLFKD